MTNTAARAVRKPHGQPSRLPGPLPRRRAGDLLPDGAKIRGVNIPPSPAQEQYAKGISPVARFATMWSQWDPTAVQKSLDHAMAVEANVVRVFGTVLGIFQGLVTRTQVLNQWDQVSGWCQQRGLFLYPTGVDGNQFDGFGSIPWATLQPEMIAWAKHMQQLPDVMGLDLVQENDSFRESANGLTLYQSIKSAGVTLPCTYSCSTPISSTNFAPGYCADRMDFLDFHVYYANVTTTLLDSYWSGGGTRPVLIGEFSHAVDGQYYSAPFWIDRFEQVRTFVTHVGPNGQRVAGAQTWCAEDTYPFFPVGAPPFSPADNFGLFDYWGHERTWLTAEFKKFPKT